MRLPLQYIYLSILRGGSVSANPPFPQSGPVPTHQPNRRSSAQICVICRFGGRGVRGWSRSTIVVDGGSSGGVYAKGDACVAPTQIYRIHRAWTRPIGTRFVLLRVVLVINRRLGICGVSGFPPSTVTAGGGFFEVFTCRATQCVAPTQIYRTHCGWTRPLVTRCVPFVLSGVVAVDNRGRWGFTWRCLRPGRRVRRPPRSMSSTGSTLPSAPAWVAGIAGGHKNRGCWPRGSGDRENR